MDTVKYDCLLNDAQKDRCKGLKDLYCAFEKKPCNFYKSKKEQAENEKKNSTCIMSRR